MNLPNISGLVAVGKTFLMANRPEILLATAVTATVGTAILAAKGGYEARGIVDEATEKKGEPLEVKEKIQLTWLCYMPAAITCTTALGSMGGLHLVHVKEKKALATAGLAALEEVKKEFKQYEKENTVGAMSNEEKQKILEERAEKTPIGENNASHIQNCDHEVEELQLIRDPHTGRDIWSSKVRIEEAMVEVGNMINASAEASLNNFYEQAGYARVDNADDLGWSGVIPTISWVDQNGIPITGVRDDGRVWRGFRYVPAPEKDFDSKYA
jgi:hypothetical protein